MGTVLEIEEAVTQLSAQELARFREWFEEFDAQLWDRQFESNVRAGKLDRMAADSIADSRVGYTTTPMPNPVAVAYPQKEEGTGMSSTAIATITKMMESLPEPAQEQVVEHLRDYLEDLQDELQWDILFKKTQPQLIAAARRAKEEMAQGLARPMDYDRL